MTSFLSHIIIIAVLLGGLRPSLAYQQETHKRIVIDAVAYMAAHPETTRFAKFAALVEESGYPAGASGIETVAEIMGQGAFDVDDFDDTYLCGAVTGNCVNRVLGALNDIDYLALLAVIPTFTAYWHFQNHTQGGDVHGNDLGGYNYQLLTQSGLIDEAAAAWLFEDYMDDGHGDVDDMRGLFGVDLSQYNTYGLTEAQYRHNGLSNKEMYSDFESMPFQPIDNLGQYWYEQFLAAPSFQTLGFVMHTTDLLQPHHVWTTSSHHHAGYEAWVADYYDQENLNDSVNHWEAVTTAYDFFDPVPPDTTDIRPLLTQAGAFAYANGGMVLVSRSHQDRLNVAEQMIPYAIAMVVHILNHAMDQLVIEVEEEPAEVADGHEPDVSTGHGEGGGGAVWIPAWLVLLFFNKSSLQHGLRRFRKKYRLARAF